jgi:H+/gluconate symporter-like permease
MVENTAPRHSRYRIWLEVVGLGTVFAAIIAILTYYGGIHPIWSNRLASALSGIALGFPAAAVFHRSMYRSD